MTNRAGAFAILSLIGLISIGYAQANEKVQRSQGRYMNHSWCIDENHLIWWDDKPYVPYGFTGNGDVDQMMRLGFNQFHVGPAEQLWAASDDPAKRQEAVQRVNELTERLTARGATYYANLNILWPTGNEIAPQDRVTCVVKRVWDLAAVERGGPLEVSFVSEARLRFDRAKCKVFWFDMTEGRYRDVTDKLKDVRSTQEIRRESPAEPGTVNRHTLVLEHVDRPDSHELRITFLGIIERENVPGVYPSALPALWKPGIQRYFRDSLTSLKTAYAQEGLRGMSFGDEINTYRASPFGSGIYIDLQNDAVALQAYRGWLKERFKTIAGLNAFLGTTFGSFADVTWRIYISPFMERDREHARGKPVTFGLFDSFEQLERIGNVQEEFRIWFYGHWLTRYARMAKEIIGDVPVFVTSAGMGGPAGDYLQIHKHALLEGVDGLSRNHYAWVGKTEGGQWATFEAGTRRRFPLETVAEMLHTVQRQAGKTKALWANEFGRPRQGEEGFVDDFGLGNQFSFPSKEDLRNFLSVLIDNGYRGFNMFKMNPSVEAARQEVQWMAELKEEILRRTVADTRVP